MNLDSLEIYAPQARKDFKNSVTAKAAQYGLTAAKIEPMTEKGDVVLISGKPFTKAVGDKRKRLEDRIKKNGFEYTMEAMAYTWFNRLVAIRYMELHGYLEHGFRVLSHPEDHAQPEILEKAQYVDLPGLDQKKVIELKLDGTKEEELYRLLLTAQFNALSKAMSFLFEKIDDETELMLPDNLLNSDSLIRKLVTEIDEDDWKEVEIIGWLYQFYISDKKDEVIGKVVKSEDIPAATQLFTPNWIVKYLVQNTIGRQWLATYPHSSLRSKMEYYIEPAEQTPEVQEKLRAITPTSLNPEELTLLDPACGSGHILVEAYDLFKAIYEERGYRSKDIPALILQKNLFGLEIDDRAAQLAAFALMMKARADYPRIFDSEAQPNIVSFVESKGLDAEEIHYALTTPIATDSSSVTNPITRRDAACISKADIESLIKTFSTAKTFGSLIQVPSDLAGKCKTIEVQVDCLLKHGDLTHHCLRSLLPILRQALLLQNRHDVIVTNPPYMGSKYFNEAIKKFFADGDCMMGDYSSDLFSAFIIRCRQMAKSFGRLGFMSPFTWMFISTHEQLRNHIISSAGMETLIQLEYSGFKGATVPVCTFTINNDHVDGYKSAFIRLADFRGPAVQGPKTLEAIRNRDCGWMFFTKPSLFRLLPGSPIAYWIPHFYLPLFKDLESLNGRAVKGLDTNGNIDSFLRRWFEVSISRFSVLSSSGAKWFPIAKGGAFRKWYGNHEYVIDFLDNGKRLKENKANLRNKDRYFSQGITWTVVSSGGFSVRILPEGFLFDQGGSAIFLKPGDEQTVWSIMASLNSKIGSDIATFLCPTLNFTTGDVNKFLVSDCVPHTLPQECVDIAKEDWDNSEVSWDFRGLELIQKRKVTVLESLASVEQEQFDRIERMRTIEQKINSILIDRCGLNNLVNNEATKISLYYPTRDEDVKRLLSYVIGCTMGRYSLDKPGLIYAHSGNVGFDPSQYKTFRADDDGIIPLLDSDWGIRDDAANRIFEFISVAWPKEHLDVNLKFVADSLIPSNGEQPKDTIRRYMASGFYKHHLSMYNKRPIYWLFSSGKQRAFQCLVYLHRYNEGTLARMRTENVIPLMGKMTARLEHLQGPSEQKGTGGEIAATSAVTVKRKLEKERDNIKMQLAELQAFDEKLRHYADLRIKLDLDDGVKVNYGKFSDPEIGNILAEVKTICGTKDED